MPQDWFSQNAPKQGGDWFSQNAPGAKPKEGFLKSFDAQTGISQMVAHPIDTIMGIPTALKNEAQRSWGEMKAANAATDPVEVQRHITAAVPFMGAGVVKAGDQVDQGNYSGAAGTLSGVVANQFAPEVVPEAVKAAPKAIRSTGEAAQAAGNKLINETVGAYKKDFNRGANPGRGYNEAVGGPSMSMRSLAAKADAVKNQTGDAIGKVIEKSSAKNDLIPINDVVEALNGPMKEQYDLETGPGGMGNTEPYEKYAQNFKDVIQNGIKNGGLTAQEVFDLKRSIAKRTKWSNTTPEGIMDVRQGQVGALGGLLTEKIPELADLNRNYQDLVGLADRSAWRAESGALPFRKIVQEGSKMAAGGAAALHGGTLEGLGAYGVLAAADSVPGRTAAATGLFKAGQGLNSIAGGLTSIADRIDQLRSAAKNAMKPGVSNPVEQQAVASTPKSNAAATQAIIQSLQAVQKLRGNREQ